MSLIFSVSLCLYVCMFLTSSVFPDGDPTPTPPEAGYLALWISLFLLFLFVIACVFGLILLLRFRRAARRLQDAEGHDVKIHKVPSGDDPTYGVRDVSWLTSDRIQENFPVF